MGKIQVWAETIKKNIEAVFFGKSEVIEKILIALLCRGHALLEDIPGVGKTILARALSASIGGKFTRIQATPDLLPADVIGVTVFDSTTGKFQFREGPIMTNLLLVDEINRATPRTQSALLESMGENQISVEGKRIELPDPFLVLATQNPIEFEGTFPLPEAQKDRFLLTVAVGYPNSAAEKMMLHSQRQLKHPVIDLKPVTDIKTLLELQTEVVQLYVHPEIEDYILEIIAVTRKDVRFKLGVSPRGALALYKSCQALAAIRGRDYVIPEDIKELVLPVFSTRVLLKSDVIIKGIQVSEVIQDILSKVPIPVIKDKT